MITRTNERKTLTKHISCECKCKFAEAKWNSDQWWNNDKCWCEFKKLHICGKDCVAKPSTCICENGKSLASIMNDPVITWGEIIDVEETNFNEKKTWKTQNFYILLPFY